MENDPRRGLSLLGSENRNPAQAVAPPLLGFRRLVGGMGSRVANPRFTFSLAALAILGAKVIHIYTHLSALPAVQLVRWGYSFFAQDILLLIILRLLLGGWLSSARSEGLLRRIAAFTSWVFIAFVIGLNVIGICFFAVAGSEIHWRNIGLASDAAGRALLLTGLFFSALVIGALLLLAWALKDVLFVAVGLLADIVCWPFVFAARGCLGRSRGQGPYPTTYFEIPQQDVEYGAKDEGDIAQHSFEFNEGWEGAKTWPWAWLFWLAAYILAGVALSAQVILCILRPHESSLTFMSWTPALLLFIDFKNSSPNLEKLVPYYNSGINRDWDNRTALGTPIPLSWLPQDSILPGFEAWYKNESQYNAALDPIRISNLGDDLLPQLRKLKEAPIRHVICVVLESTRKDVFPIKDDGINVARLRESWDGDEMPPDALDRLQTLTPIAKFLTGDHDDGFNHEGREEKSRGGLNFNDAYTTSTYTLKSLAGTLCGITPLVADFNLEYQHHIYQPCLPHILSALNTIDNNDAHGFASYKWKSSFMQSVTLDFDHFGGLMKKIGFPADGLIDSEYLRSKSAKFGPVHLKNINYFGMEEAPLEDYIRDQLESAKKSNERVFITHVTSTSHHPYNMPESEEYVPLGRGLDDLSHYINAIGYDDRWLGKILDMLDELDVADETLLVLVGDHGLSIPENDVLATYYNPNVGSNHVPLVFSHPKLPPITIDDAVSSQQILPTVLDLLIETESLSKPATQAARDLLHNYEGQSLIRPVHKAWLDTANRDIRDSDSSTNSTSLEIANWHFTVINPGRAMLGVRDARHKSRRIVIPVLDNIEWHFTDVTKDPREAEPVLGFDFTDFIVKIEKAHGEDVARWAEEAAFVARWWVEENSKRWRYGPYAAY
ncbi:hypothetical protein EsH8_VII_000084 [Colletotrichum jinshuiense]